MTDDPPLVTVDEAERWAMFAAAISLPFIAVGGFALLAALFL